MNLLLVTLVLAVPLTIVFVAYLLIQFCSDQRGSRSRIVSHLASIGWSILASSPLMIVFVMGAFEFDQMRQGRGVNSPFPLVTLMSMLWAAPLIIGELFLCLTILTKKKVQHGGRKRAGSRILAVLSTGGLGLGFLWFWAGLPFFLHALSESHWFPSIVQEMLNWGAREFSSKGAMRSLYAISGLGLAIGMSVHWFRAFETDHSAPAENPDMNPLAP